MAAGKTATRQYAKRQYTWFRRQPPADWPRFEAPLDCAAFAGCPSPAGLLKGRRMRVYFDADADLALIRAKRVAILGYGNQGRAQALNLRDSGVDVTVALQEGSARRARARSDGFDVMTAAEAAAEADLVVMLAADEDHGRIYAEEVAPNLREGAALSFAHGLSIRFGLIEPRPDLDIFLVAPKGPGTALRHDFTQGSGLISLFAVHQDASGGAEALALSYAAAIGSRPGRHPPDQLRRGMRGGPVQRAGGALGRDPRADPCRLRDAGRGRASRPEIAYFECLTEVKLLADLIYERGIAGMREAISNTAEFGALKGGSRIVTADTRTEMRRILREVRAGHFTRELIEDAEAGYPRLRASRAQAASHPIEETMRKLRKLKE